jgi:predicted fused transcriptional regulator/phosphomethylpyrimidine kinase
MLQNLNDQFRDCIERAAECANFAQATSNPRDRQDWVALEGRYLALARGIQFVGLPAGSRFLG